MIEQNSHGKNSSSSGKNSYATKLGSITITEAVIIPRGIKNISDDITGPDIMPAAISHAVSLDILNF
jgi:hypothetical protein